MQNLDSQKKLFYSHLIEIESLTLSLEEMDLDEEEKKHLAELLDSTIQHTILDLVLSKLSEKDKEIFVEKLRQNPHDQELMKFLTDKVENIEDEIKQAVKDLKEELHEDIQEAKRNG